MIKKVIFGLLTIVLTTFTYSKACTIIPQTREQKFNNAQLVVSGKITAKASISQNSKIFGDIYNEQLQFTVYEIYKGYLSGNMITLLNDSNSTCGTNTIGSGEYYTFYLYDNTKFKHFPAYGISSLNTYVRKQPEIKIINHSLRHRILNFFKNIF